MNKRRLKKLIKKSKFVSVYAIDGYNPHVNVCDITFHKYGFSIYSSICYPYNWIIKVTCG